MSKDHPLSFGFMIRIKQGLGFFCFVALLFLSLSPSASAQDAIRQRTFAVLEFDGVGVPDQTMQDVSERFANEYANFKKGEFILLNREQMRQNLQEQNIRVFGCSSFKCGVEAGNALGVDFIVVGTLTKNGPVYSLKSQLIDVEDERTISRAEYDNIMGDILTIMSTEVKKAAAFVASADVESDILQTKSVDAVEPEVIILPLEISLDETFDRQKISELINEWIRGEVTFSGRANLTDFKIEQQIIQKEEFKNGLMSSQVAKTIGLQYDATHVIMWTLRVTETKSQFVLNHFNIMDKPESVPKQKWLIGGLRTRFSTKKDMDEMKLNVRKYTWPILGATPPEGRFPKDGFFTKIWFKIINTIDNFFFYVENTYGITAVLIILVLLSGFGLFLTYKALEGEDPGPEIGFPPEY